MSQVFISYSRRDLEFVKQLVKWLEANNIDSWLDQDDIEPAADWRERIRDGIENADNFIFVISPTSVQSNECRHELDIAVRNNKRMIPILYRETDPQLTHPALAAINWIYFRDPEDDFQTAFTKLVTAISSDLAWAHAHSRIQSRALEWQRNNQDPSFLLRGSDLQDAEQLLASAGPDKNPQPTELQRKFVLASRQDATRRQRRNFIAISIAFVLVVGMAFMAFIQRGIAVDESNKRSTAQVQAEDARSTAVIERDLKATAQVNAEHAEATAIAERDIAVSRQLAAQAQALMSDRFDLALLLAIEASRGTTDGQLSLSKILLSEPRLVRIVSSPKGYLWQGGGFVESLALSPDGNQLVAQSYDSAKFWDLNSLQEQDLTPEMYQKYTLDWAPYQIPTSRPEDWFQALNTGNLTLASSAVPNREAFSACQTQIAAGGGPGCSSLIYVFGTDFQRLVTPLASCTPNETTPNFGIELERGLYRISDFQSVSGLPTDFELYSVALANKTTDFGSKFIGALYDPQSNQLITAAVIGRFYSAMALIVWDLDEMKPVMELLTAFWNGEQAKINFSNDGTALDVCEQDTRIRVDIAPESWRAQACEIAGRNLLQAEWQQYFPGEGYRKTCPQWPPGE